MARDDEGHDDVELSDLEDGAFIPKPYDQPSALTRWMPPRLRVFVQNLSRIKVRSYDGRRMSLEGHGFRIC